MDEYFQAALAELKVASESLGDQIGALESNGVLTDRQIDELVEPIARQLFGSTSPVAYGAGFVASLELVGASRGYLSWWQGPLRSQLRLAAQTPNKELIDYSAFEWFRVPLTKGHGHISGPHVDYLCSDEYTLTASVPITYEGRFLGVVALDLLVDDVEADLLPVLEKFGVLCVVNSSHRILASTQPELAPGDSVRSFVSNYSRTDCQTAQLYVLTKSS
ncbi:hypothetical protein [Arthrobacter flavus]|uniref:Cache domain-containing protein n=1 Tax=Arthrobacter flavus TaxID=95172 RepID=A0ABW4Q737_9MICC